MRFYFSFLSCFPASCVFHGFSVLYCMFLIVLLFLPWICLIGFPVSLVFLHLPVYYVFFPALVFVHCPHSFLLQLICLVLVVVVVVGGGGGGGGGGGCCCFGTFMYFLWADG